MRTNPDILKLSSLFARYLYQHRRLNLPGIGVFSIDPSVAIPDASDKNYSDFIQQIKYEQKPVVSADEDLINFIRTETGKIKPLAESDLDSFLSDGKILLNIGKPFHIEGIGSLMKTKSGAFEFTPGDLPAIKMEGFYHETTHDDGHKKRTSIKDEPSASTGSRKALITVAVIAGLILIVWGGYSLYHHNTPKTDAVTAQNDYIPVAPKDTQKANILLDSVKKIIDSSKAALTQHTATSNGNTANYKFVIEKTASKERALKRYQQLKDSRYRNKNANHRFHAVHLIFHDSGHARRYCTDQRLAENMVCQKTGICRARLAECYFQYLLHGFDIMQFYSFYKVRIDLFYIFFILPAKNDLL